MPLTLSLTLTDEQLAAIDHVAIEGAEAWVQHAFDHFVKKIITDKAAKYHDECVACKAMEGAAYKTAAQRDADRQAAERAKLESRLLKIAAERQAKIDALKATGLTEQQATILVS